jgi:hypothetical protein
MSNDKNGNGSLTESFPQAHFAVANSSSVLRNLQDRVKFLESKVGSMNTPLEVNSAGRPWSVVPQDLVPQRASQDNSTLFIEFGAGVSTVNSGTRNIEFYGISSLVFHLLKLHRCHLKLRFRCRSCSFPQ